MTKEEAIENIKLIRFNAAITNANSFKEALDMAIEALSQQPSLPSDLDEAAEEWCKRNNKGIALCADKKSHYLVDGIDAFKACAEWMAGQGVSMLGRVGIYGVDVESITKELREAGFNLGEEIILQIRKKQ